MQVLVVVHGNCPLVQLAAELESFPMQAIVRLEMPHFAKRDAQK